MDKEFLYVGHYFDILGRALVKIGTTNDIDRRTKEHTRNYRKAKEYTLGADQEFQMDAYIPLSKYNTLRYEDLNRELLREIGFGEYIRNDRFLCGDLPESVPIKIKKTYIVSLTV